MHPDFAGAAHQAGAADAADLLDVLIVGAGLSGIGAAATLRRRCPDKRFALLEARAAIGGTRDLFRYPGVRSDSDMYTLGYGFRPWAGADAIADGAAIRDYIAATAREHGVDAHIRFKHTVVKAAWCSKAARWTVEARLDDGATALLQARFLYLCSGYYDYGRAHRPRFKGEADFQGRIVQPQFWPQDLDYRNLRVVVVGSGATAVSLVPAMAQQAAHVTMLQRSPSYVVARPARDAFALRLRRWLPTQAAHTLARWRIVLESIALYRLLRALPGFTRKRMIAMAARMAGPRVDAATHFAPAYKPWDQRICVAPGGDLFRALRAGRADVVTDRIARFSRQGVVLASGRELEADVVVMATGLRIKILGGAQLTVDGRPVDPGRAMAYKGMMLSGVPNCALAFGYTNASWTLKADLTAVWVCRLLRWMDRRGAQIALAPRDPAQAEAPFLDLSSGYVQRASYLLPKQGRRHPWRVHQNYLRDLLAIRLGRIDDGVLQFRRAGGP
jgi:cyclohexanone monooxygenase